jgi:hypothetical protein
MVKRGRGQKSATRIRPRADVHGERRNKRAAASLRELPAEMRRFSGRSCDAGSSVRPVLKMMVWRAARRSGAATKRSASRARRELGWRKRIGEGSWGHELGIWALLGRTAVCSHPGAWPPAAAAVYGKARYLPSGSAPRRYFSVARGGSEVLDSLVIVLTAISGLRDAETIALVWDGSW